MMNACSECREQGSLAVTNAARATAKLIQEGTGSLLIG
jgi:hypothetical protein